jgi:pyridoxamine 5'-phosphate oxidase
MKDSTNTPLEIRHRIWAELGRATQDRHHAWRTPVLATTGEDGLPHARTVVLREADVKTSHLGFYTDGRSAKVSQLSKQPNGLLVFWSKRLNWQLRVRVSVVVHATGPLVESVWARVGQSTAAGDYLSLRAPGTALSGAQTADVSAEHNLTVIHAEIQEIDWLELAREGHRRARIYADTWEWLTP